MPRLCESLKHQALVQLRSGVSTRKVADSLGMSQSSVAHLRREISGEIEKQRGGRPKVLGEQEKRLGVHLVTAGRLKTASAAAKQLREKTGKHFSDITLRRALREAGLGACVQQKKPLLAKRHVLARLSFAHKYKNWTVDDWRRVIFSDETKINLINSDGRSWCWLREGERLGPKHVSQTVKHGGGSIMIWGCMTAFGPGAWYQIEGRMEQHLYKKNLETYLQSTIQNYNLDPTKVVFQHDNDPKHTAKSVQFWLSSQPFQLLQWPAQSPDLNPMEHFWALLKQRLSQVTPRPRGVQELWENVCSIYPSFDAEDCEKLYKSMPRRISAVLEAKGYWTKY
jgi:transposase